MKWSLHDWLASLLALALWALGVALWLVALPFMCALFCAAKFGDLWVWCSLERHRRRKGA